MFLRSKLLYSPLYLTSMIPNYPSETTLPSDVAPKIKFSELIARPHVSATE